MAQEQSLYYLSAITTPGNRDETLKYLLSFSPVLKIQQRYTQERKIKLTVRYPGHNYFGPKYHELRLMRDGSTQGEVIALIWEHMDMACDVEGSDEKIGPYPLFIFRLPCPDEASAMEWIKLIRDTSTGNSHHLNPPFLMMATRESDGKDIDLHGEMKESIAFVYAGFTSEREMKVVADLLNVPDHCRGPIAMKNERFLKDLEAICWTRSQGRYGRSPLDNLAPSATWGPGISEVKKEDMDESTLSFLGCPVDSAREVEEARRECMADLTTQIDEDLLDFEEEGLRTPPASDVGYELGAEENTFWTQSSRESTGKGYDGDEDRSRSSTGTNHESRTPTPAAPFHSNSRSRSRSTSTDYYTPPPGREETPASQIPSWKQYEGLTPGGQLYSQSPAPANSVDNNSPSSPLYISQSGKFQGDSQPEVRLSISQRYDASERYDAVPSSPTYNIPGAFPMSFIRESSNQPRGLTVPEAQSIQRTSASPPPAYQTGYSTWKPNRSTLTAPTPPHGNVAGEQGGRAVNMSGLLEALGGALGGAVGTSTPAPKLGRFSQASSGKCYNVNKPLPPIPHPNNDPNSGSKPPVRAPSNQQSLARDFQNDCLGNRWDNPIVIDPEVEPEYVTDLDTEQDWDVEIEGSPFNVASSRSENVHTNKNSNNNNFNTPTPRSRWPSEPEQLYDIFRPFDEIDVGNMSDILELPPTQVLPSEASASPDAPKMIWRPRPPSKHTRGASISKSGRDATGTSSHGSRSSSDKSKKSSRRSSIRR